MAKPSVVLARFSVAWPFMLYTMPDSLPPSNIASAPPSKPRSRFKRLLDGLRSGVIRVRRGGVPHEQTVVIPALAVFFSFNAYEGSSWPLWLPLTFVAVTTTVCGAWLGLAWRGSPVVSVLLRPLYFGALVVLLQWLTHDIALSKQEVIREVGAIYAGLGGFFYIGFMYAALARDILLRRFVSEKHRQRYHARTAQMQRGMARVRYIRRLALGREDKNQAPETELMLAKFAETAMSPQGAAVVISTLLAVLVSVWKGLWALAWLLAPAPL